MKNPILLWINAILFYDLSNIMPRPKGKQAQLDWMAENRAIEDYDYMKLQDGKVII